MPPSIQAASLVTVNTAPERARVVIGQLIDNVKLRYSLVHEGNAETIESVRPLLLSIKPRPNLLFCASMWTPEQQDEIQRIAHEAVPGIKTHAIPTGLQVKMGPQGVIKYLEEQIDSIMQG